MLTNHTLGTTSGDTVAPNQTMRAQRISKWVNDGLMLVLKANPFTQDKIDPGGDWILADMHGHSTTLDQALLHPEINAPLSNKHCIIIAGDFLDRGPDNEGMIRKLMAYMKDTSLPEIYAVKGNHEQACLDIINLMASKLFATNTFTDALKDMQDNIANKKWGKHKAISVLRRMFHNTEELKAHNELGGEWMIHLFLEELLDKKIIITNGITYFHKTSFVCDIKLFIESLPTMIYVEKNKYHEEYVVTHGDNPFGKSTMQALLNGTAALKKGSLLEEYLLSARPESPHCLLTKIGPKRDTDSIRTYCGHSIIIPPPNAMPQHLPIRIGDTINLDSGSYESKILLRVNHCTHKVYATLLDVTLVAIQTIQNILDHIQFYLNFRKQFSSLQLSTVNGTLSTASFFHCAAASNNVTEPTPAVNVSENITGASRDLEIAVDHRFAACKS